MGDFFQFLANHVVASLLGAVGGIFSLLGFAEQANAIVTKFKAWQLQALGAAFFFVAVVMVLFSYESERRAPATSTIGATADAAGSVSPDPNVLAIRSAFEQKSSPLMGGDTSSARRALYSCRPSPA